MTALFISKSDLELAVLYKLYVAANSDHGELLPEELSRLFDPRMPLTRVRLALDALQDGEQINWRQTNNGIPVYSITNSGLQFLEKQLGESGSLIHQYALRGDGFLADRAAPASDRIVTFDDNQPEVLEISRGIAEVRECLRGDNSEGINEAERQRVLIALDAAQQFWNSAHLRLIQLKVGVLMAVEDAGQLLKTTAKAASIDLLVETIKAFARNVLKVDLDNVF